MSDEKFFSILLYVICMMSFVFTAALWVVLANVSRALERRAIPHSRKGKTNVV